MNTLHTRLLILAILSAALACLTACTTQGKKSVDTAISDAVENQATGSAQQDTLTPEYYINLASQAQGEERQRFLIKAAELLIQRGDIELAQDQLRNLKPEELELSRQTDIQILAARIALKNKNPVEAINLLPAADILSFHQTIDVAQVRADANFQLGYYLKAATIRIGIDERIEADDRREANHQGIWLALSSLPEVSLQQTVATDTITQGWIELARIFRSAQLSISKLQNDILDWGTTHPQHPISNNFIDSIIDLHIANRKITDTVAVLLPLSGKLAGVASAIRSGLLSAHYQRSSDDRPIMLRFYDTADSQIDFESLYQQALADGASSMIGPIDKAAISKLAQKPELDVPVLTLNYAENAFTDTGNLYQFGLLPEDEAEQAAELAIRDGRQRAAVLVPDSEWGRRLQQAFQIRFKQLGGDIVGVQQFDQNKDDYSKPIRSLFDIDKSDRRHRNLQNLLGKNLKFQPYRRQDVDMIFIAANSRSGRGIMPAFKFHRAGDLPVYATSHIYTGSQDKRADRDLNGIIFCDLPWNITSQNNLKQTFDRDWPEHKNLTRLFAMGADAYHLVSNLAYLQNNAFARFSGETGNLYLDEYGRFHRELVWAQFRKGLPEYIDTITAPEIDNGELIENNADRESNRTGVL